MRSNELSFPVLHLESCRVVPFSERHLTERYVAWLNDPHVVRYSEQRHRHHTIESCRAYLDSFRESTDHFLAIEMHAEDLGHVGNIAVAVDPANHVADMSIIVGEKGAWGTGVASMTWCAVLEELLTGQKMRKVTAGTMAENTKMLRLISRSGMEIEATKRKQFLWEGREVDLICAAMFSDRIVRA